jgi:membrane protein DedA with SNARE-associated domain
VFAWLEDTVSGAWWSYFVILAVAAIDAFFPLVPSETLVIIGGGLASSGALVLPLVILSGAVGAFIGDNISYGIGSLVGERTVKRWFAGEKAHRRFDWAERQLEERGAYIIIIGRFIPGGRTAVTFSSGYIHAFPWKRFALYDAAAALIWATYAAMLGYFGGKTFENEPWKGILLAFGVALGVAACIEGIRHVVQRRRARRGMT